MKKRKPITTSSDWTFDHIQKYYKEIERIGVEQLKLDIYPNQIEIVDTEQMLDAYAASGMPIFYQHWSFGKTFLEYQKSYQRGQMGLAYELVLNSSPCISYLMEENTMMMQILVMAHACMGHNAVFKNNFMFKDWTNAETIIDYLAFAKHYIAECEEKYGPDTVEAVIDACHAIQDHGIDRYKRPPRLSLTKERERQQERLRYQESQVNELWNHIPKPKQVESLGQFLGQTEADGHFPREPQENIMYFIEKNAPKLEPWKREIIRIVRKISQYFYPQRSTKVLNEGFATFTHYEIVQRLYQENLIPVGFMMEFMRDHTNVIKQYDFDAVWKDDSGKTYVGRDGQPIHLYSGINPYALGFAMFKDIKRICENPTEEDKEWFKDWAGSDWIETTQFAMKNFKDESFILQFLSPKLIRDFRLFGVTDDTDHPLMVVDAIHDDQGYKQVRKMLANSYAMEKHTPDIQVSSVDKWHDRTLTLTHYVKDKRLLDKKQAQLVGDQVETLWQFPVKIEEFDDTTMKINHIFDSRKDNGSV